MRDLFLSNKSQPIFFVLQIKVDVVWILELKIGPYVFSVEDQKDFSVVEIFFGVRWRFLFLVLATFIANLWSSEVFLEELGQEMLVNSVHLTSIVLII